MSTHASRPDAPARRILRLSEGSNLVDQEAERIVQQLAEDPAFRVITVAGDGWIDPFTGAAISAADGWLDTAKDHLLRTRPWTRARHKPLAELEVLRWLHHLKAHIRDEPRHRIFGKDGLWLNPYTGGWEPVTLHGGRITQATLQEMAQILAQEPQAQSGRLLTASRLERLAKGHGDGTAHPELSPSAEFSAPVPRTPRPQAAAPVAAAPAPAAPPLPASRAKEPARALLARMRPVLPKLDGYRLAVHAGAPGAADFHDVITAADGAVWLVLGDVTTDGDAAPVTVAVLKALRALAADANDATTLVGDLASHIAGDLDPAASLGLSALHLDPGTGALDCVCVGHHPAILASLRRRHLLSQIGDTAAAITVAPAPGWRAGLRAQRVQLTAGDTLVQCSAGIFAARDARGETFGRLRALATLVGALDQPCERLAGGLAETAGRFAGGGADGTTVLALRVGG